MSCILQIIIYPVGILNKMQKDVKKFIEQVLINV